MKEHNILVLFYSFTGQTAKLAREVAEGARAQGAQVVIKRVPELVPQSVFDKNEELLSIQTKLNDEFPIATVEDMQKADGIAIGSPVHFGSFASQLKQFFDQLSPVWMEGDLVGKPVSVFCSGGSTHGGEETTLLSLIIPMITLGMIPVGVPYPVQGEGPDFDAGSPFGAVFVSGHDGTKELSEGDIKIARILGKRLATMVQVLCCTCNTCLPYTELKKKEV